VKRLNEFGAAIHKRYSANLMAKRTHAGGTQDAALDGDADTFWSAPAGERHAMIEADFAQPVTFDRAVTMEWLNDGQHIERYRIEIWKGNAWVAVAEGQAIGHKKIDAFAPVTATRARLNILASAGEIRIREFQLFGVD
jgi:alpha-L-fucosidase